MYTHLTFQGYLTGQNPQQLEQPVKDHPFHEKVVGFNPSEKYARQIGSSLQGSGWKLRKTLKPPNSIAIFTADCDEIIRSDPSKTS